METAAAVVSAIVAALAFVGWYWDRRAKSLRADDVLVWANEAIKALQTIFVICAVSEDKFPASYLEHKMADLLIETSTLVERGRLFFRNVIEDDFGIEKPEAYRGYRPRILDHLVVGHQIACAWKSADEATRAKLAKIAEEHTKMFVSLVRNEVGRDRTSSGGAATRGHGIHLDWLLTEAGEAVSRNRDRL